MLKRIPEREFLITIAVQKFKNEYQVDIPVESCDVKSIDPNVHYEYAYEIVTTRFDDHLRFRIFFNLGDETKFNRYRLENEQGKISNKDLIDEIYVATGTVDRYYREQGIYRFRRMGEDPSRYDVLLNEDGTPLLMENNEFLVIERGIA